MFFDGLFLHYNFIWKTLRYKKTNDIENKWYTNKQLIIASSIFLLLVHIYAFTITFINSHFELQSFNIYSVCLKGQNASMNKPIFNILTVLMPIIIVVIITCIMDYSCYLWLHRVHPNEEIQGCVFSDIPLRATLISTHLFLVGICSCLLSVIMHHRIFCHQKNIWWPWLDRNWKKFCEIHWLQFLRLRSMMLLVKKMLRKKGNDVNKILKYRMHWKEERHYDNLSKIFKYLSQKIVEHLE